MSFSESSASYETDSALDALNTGAFTWTIPNGGTGSLPLGSTVTAVDPDSNGGSNSWVLTIPANKATATGEYTLTWGVDASEATDLAGNALSIGSFSFTVPAASTTQPQITSVALFPNAIPGAGTPVVATLTFSAPVFNVTASSFSLTANGGANELPGSGSNAATVNQVNSTTWTLTLPGGLIPSVGNYLLSWPTSASTPTDADGDPLASGSYGFAVPVEIPESLELEPSEDTGPFQTPNLTNITTPLTFIGTAPPGSTVTLFDDGIPDGIGTTGENGNFSVITQSGFSAGTYSVAATDTLSGQTSQPTASVSLTVDTSQPEVTGVTVNPSPVPGTGMTLTFALMFSETVYNFSAGALTLTAPGGSPITLSTSNATVSAQNPNEIGTGGSTIWTVTVSGSEFSQAGLYKLGWSSSGIVSPNKPPQDLAGNDLVAGSYSLTVPAQANSADPQITNVNITPSPIPGPGTALTIALTFSEPVTGVTAGAFDLTEGNGSDLLPGGASVVANNPTDGFSNNWTLNIPAGLVASAGDFVLSWPSSSSAIEDQNGNPLVNGAFEFQVLSTPVTIVPPIIQSPNPATAGQSVSVTLTFSTRRGKSRDRSVHLDCARRDSAGPLPANSTVLNNSGGTDASTVWVITIPGSGIPSAGNYTLAWPASSASPAPTDLDGNPLEADAFLIEVTGTQVTPITLSPTTLVPYDVGQSVNQTITASGGNNSSFTYSVSSGALPTGLTLNSSTGVISGAPTTPGGYSFTIEATDSADDVGSQPYNVTVNSSLSSISPSILPGWDLNQPGYDQTVTASGGSSPYTYSLTAGGAPRRPDAQWHQWAD